MYTRIALGKSSAMDVVGGETSASTGQLWVLYPMLFALQGLQVRVLEGVRQGGRGREVAEFAEYLGHQSLEAGVDAPAAAADAPSRCASVAAPCLCSRPHLRSPLLFCARA